MRQFPPPRVIKPVYGAAKPQDEGLDFEEYSKAHPQPDYFYELEWQLRSKLLEEGGLKLTWLNSGESNKLFHGAGVQLLDKRSRVLCSFAGLDDREAIDMVLQYKIRLEAARERHWLSSRQHPRTADED